MFVVRAEAKAVEMTHKLDCLCGCRKNVERDRLQVMLRKRRRSHGAPFR